MSSLLRSTDLDLGAVDGPDEPPADLGARIAIAVERARADDGVDAPPPVAQLEAARTRRATRPGRVRRLTLAALAVAAVIVVGIASIGVLRTSSPRTNAES